MGDIVELELWSLPFKNSAPLDARAIAEQCRLATSASEAIVLGLNFVPGPTDVLLLEAKIKAGEVSEHEFQQFCGSHRLAPDVTDPKSAAHFMVFAEGQSLAWLHFPASGDGEVMARFVHRWASAAGYIICLGQGEPALAESEIQALWPC